MPETASKFWQMIVENKVTVIFALTKVEETDINGKFVNILMYYRLIIIIVPCRFRSLKVLQVLASLAQFWGCSTIW